MKGIHLVLVLGAVAATCGLPLDQQQAKSPNVVTGVFIPSDAFKNLQDRANANSQNNQQQIQGSQPSYQPVHQNQPQYQINQQPPLTNQQPTQNNQQPIITVQQQQPSLNTQQQVVTTQQQVLTPQPANNQQIQAVASNNQQIQPFVYQQSLTPNRDPKQSIIVMSNQPGQQSNQPIVLLQQPASNQPIYVQQPTQVQGNQGYVLPNVQSGQPTQVIIATNPSDGNQVQGTLVQSQNQNQPGSTVYTLIPLNGQNNIVNSNSGGSYVPVQSGGSSPVVLSTGQ